MTGPTRAVAGRTSFKNEDPHGAPLAFSERYAELRARRPAVREDMGSIREEVVSCIWYDHLYSDAGLATGDGRPLRVISPGWWNRSEGPDFLGAQIEFNGKLRNGDVEIHLGHGDWKGHGHHLDSRYDDVMLIVALESKPPATAPHTSAGKPIPILLLRNYLNRDIHDIAQSITLENYPYESKSVFGGCAGLVESYGAHRLERLLALAGEWRMVNKARSIRERMERAGADQAFYEAFMSACGFSRFKDHFRLLAGQLPYDRARQLALQDPLLLEAAYLQLAGLLPEKLPDGAPDVSHFARLHELRRKHLPGLRTMPLPWKLTGVRPANYPERRLAGVARFVARTARDGLAESLEAIWRAETNSRHRRKAFEELFPGKMGFWANHCAWTGKSLARPSAPLGSGRVHSIIGNVFIPAGLALARSRRDRLAEERILEFFGSLPKETENHVLKHMIPRVFGAIQPPKLNFRAQQGLLQMYQDWCEPNPSCRNCPVLGTLPIPEEGRGMND